MIILSPGHHPEADKFWKEKLGSRPNGARTLGGAIADNLADIFEPHYDMLVTYASDFPFEIPEGVKKIAVIWHQNYPWTEGFKVWQRVNVKLKDYDVDYFFNEKKLAGLVRDVYPKVYYLPRFIDTNEYPKFKISKSIDTLWFGNRWGEFRNEFEAYTKIIEDPRWISHGKYGVGEEDGEDIDRHTTLKLVAKAKKVWAIGICQLEAQLYGCEVFSYRGNVLPFYDQNTIRDYLANLLG